MPTSLINAYLTPESTQQPVVHEDLANLVEQMMQGDVMRFATTAARTAAFATLGFSPPNGAMSHLLDAHRFEWFNGTSWCPMPGQRIARGRRESNSTTTTTEVGVLRLDDHAVIAGVSYTVHTSAVLPFSSVANDYIGVNVRYTTDGSTPSTASTAMIATQMRCTGAGGNETSKITVGYVPATDLTLSLLLTISRVSGTGSVGLTGSATAPIELFLDSAGWDPGDSGTDV